MPILVDNTLRILETDTGTLLPTPAELFTRLSEAREQAERERERAERLAQRLRQAGLDPDF